LKNHQTQKLKTNLSIRSASRFFTETFSALKSRERQNYVITQLIAESI